MQRRLLIFSGLAGLTGLILLIVLLLQEPPAESRGLLLTPPDMTFPETTGIEKAQPLSGELKGRVVDGETGVGLPEATVLALVPYLKREKLSGGGSPRWGYLTVQRTVRTGHDGAFALTDLPENYWNLWVQKKGYAFTTMPRIKFKKEGHVIKLFRGGAIFGRVVYGDGSPAPGVRIEWTPQGLQSEVFSRYRREQWYVETDGDGRFRYDDLPPGLFTVEVWDDQSLPAPWAHQGPLKTGEERDLGTRILDSGFGMTVRVLWMGTEQPVEGITVVVVPIGDPMPRTKTGLRRITNSEGIARFSGLGGQVLEVPRFQVTVIVEGIGPVAPDGGTMWGPDSEIVYYMRRRGVVKGKVERPDGKPLARFFVMMEPLGHRNIVRPVRGAAGEFVISSVAQGRYKLTVRYASFLDKEIPTITVRPGVETDVGTIRLEEGGEVFGTLRRENGKELGRTFKVYVGRREGSRLTAVRNAYCTPTGEYRVPGIPEGTFEVWPEADSTTVETVEVRVARGGATRQDLVIPSEGYLNFVFFDIKNGERVRALPPEGGVWLKSARKGKEIRWIAESQALRPGRYTVEYGLRHPRDRAMHRVPGGSVTVKEWDPATRKAFSGIFAVDGKERLLGQDQGRSQPIEIDLPKLREKLLEDDE